MTSWKILLVIALVALMGGCKNRPVEPVQYMLLTPSDATLADAASAIQTGGVRQGWEMTQVAEDRFFATRRFRAHVAMVEIFFNSDSMRVDYRDSVNLNYDGQSIHKAYYREIGYLAGSIQSVARFMVPSAAFEEEPRGDSAGTGFVISRDNLILTNFHVAGDCEDLRVGGEPAAFLAGDKENDLALLKVEAGTTLGEGPTAGAVAVFRESPRLRKGEDVIVAGYPLGSVLSAELKITTGSLNALAGLGGDRREFQISADVQPGNSGGPALDRSGHVIGVVSSRISDRYVMKRTGTVPQNVNFAINLGMVRTFLAAEALSLETAASERNLQTYEIAERAQGFTVPVRCQR